MKLLKEEEILVLITRNLSGLADANEVSALNEWIDSSEGNRKFFAQIQNIWDVSDGEIDSEIIDASKALRMVQGRISKKSKKGTFWKYWQKAAAILILPLLMGSVLWTYLRPGNVPDSEEVMYNEVYAAFGTRSSLTLADGTSVWLNSGSTLRYPAQFSGDSREVHLEGEAYFEVKTDPSFPFLVKTANLQVKATGTKFNVQDYKQNPIAEVTLVSGKVSVNNSDNDYSLLLAELNPNQHLDYNSEKRTKQLHEEDVYKYIAWKDGKLIFRNDPLREVVMRIGQVFNVDITLQSEELQDYRYRATFQDESLNEILKLLTLTSPVKYHEIDRNPMPDGSFPKKEIIIYPANQQPELENN